MKQPYEPPKITSVTVQEMARELRQLRKRVRELEQLHSGPILKIDPFEPG